MIPSNILLRLCWGAVVVFDVDVDVDGDVDVDESFDFIVDLNCKVIFVC